MRRALTAQRLHQIISVGFDQIKHLIETVCVVPVGDISLARYRIAAKQPDRRVIARRAQRLDICQILAIHDKDQILTRKICGHNLARAQVRQIIPTRRSSVHGTAIRGLTSMPPPCASAIRHDIQPCRARLRTKDAMRCR